MTARRPRADLRAESSASGSHASVSTNPLMQVMQAGAEFSARTGPESRPIFQPAT